MSEMNHHYFLNLKNGSITLQFQRHLVTENITEDYQHFKLQCILRVQLSALASTLYMYVLAQKSFWLAQNIFFDETNYLLITIY